MTLSSASATAGADALSVTWNLAAPLPQGTVLLTADFGDNKAGITFLNGNRIGHYVITNGTQLAIPTGAWSVDGTTVTASYPNEKLNGLNPSAGSKATMTVGDDSSSVPLS